MKKILIVNIEYDCEKELTLTPDTIQEVLTSEQFLRTDLQVQVKEYDNSEPITWVR